MSYWPSYSDIDPGCRATYLEWLANGRRDPDIDIGYVFLFFYGLERRVFFDAQHSSTARSEIPKLLNEVEELLRGIQRGKLLPRICNWVFERSTCPVRSRFSGYCGSKPKTRNAIGSPNKNWSSNCRQENP